MPAPRGCILPCRSQVDAPSLMIADDGRGIDPDVAGRRVSEGHIGLASLRARVAGAGGALDVAPATPTGTVVTIDVPVP